MADMSWILLHFLSVSFKMPILFHLRFIQMFEKI